jgi:hypothetical protein
VIVNDPVAVQTRIDELKAQKSDWGNWHSNPKLVSELRSDIASNQQENLDIKLDDDQQLNELVEKAPSVLEKPQDSLGLDLPTENTVAGPTEDSVRMGAYKSTLDKDSAIDPQGYDNFMADMQGKFDAAVKLAPEGTITNQKDFTQFVQAQTGTKTPLSEINLTRKVEGKGGKIQVVQAKADVVIKQTRNKRNLAVKLLRCIHG